MLAPGKGGREHLHQVPTTRVGVPATRGNTSTGGLRLAEAILEVLYAAGFGKKEAARFYLMFVDITLGRVHRELHGDVVAPKRTNNLLAAAATKRKEFPILNRTSSAIRSITRDDIFNAELDLLIEGIRAEIRSAGHASAAVE